MTTSFTKGYKEAPETVGAAPRHLMIPLVEALRDEVSIIAFFTDDVDDATKQHANDAFEYLGGVLAYLKE